MNIIIPADENIPYIVINMLDLSRNEELEDVLSESYSKLDAEEKVKNYFDNFIFVLPKKDLIPENEENTEGLTESLKRILDSTVDLFDFPYFEKLENEAMQILQRKNYGETIDQSDRLIVSHYKNLKRSRLKDITIMSESQNVMELTKDLWNASLQIFALKSRDLPTEMQEFEMNQKGNPAKSLQNMKILDVEYLGLTYDLLDELYSMYLHEKVGKFKRYGDDEISL